MATLSNWLDAALALPKAVEAKFTMLPKLSTGLQNFDDTVLPAGPTVFPTPITFPVPDLSKLPNPPGTTTTTSSTTTTGMGKLPLSPGSNPGVGRGSIDYGPISRANLQLSPSTGTIRGTINYS